MRSLGVCLRTRQALQEDTLRRKLVQQMSSATSAIAGSIGERRNMRAELEAMVHQVEAETARAQPAPSSASAVAAVAKALDGEDVEFEVRN